MTKEEYLKNPNKCLNCSKEILPNDTERINDTIRKKFCCRSCSASYNNHIRQSPTAIKTGTCKQCGSLIIYRYNNTTQAYIKRKVCDKCKEEKKILAKKNKKSNSCKAVIKRRRNLKIMAIEYKGGQCEICGYCKCLSALEFHHKNPEEKLFTISKKGYTRSWDSVRKEIDKCILVCANCHREIHDKIYKQNT